MYASWCCWVFIVAAATATAVLTDPKPSEDVKSANSTLPPQTTPTAASKSSDDSDDETTPRKRTIEQTVGYGYRYNTVLRPVSAASSLMASVSRNRQPTYQRPVTLTPSPTPASYYFQQQVQSTSPKPVHRFSGPYAAYPRPYSRPDPSETRPVTENPMPPTATLEPQQDVYREVFTFDEAVPSPYHIAPRAEHPQLLPQALLLTSAGPHHPLPGHQQVIPVLILRLDAASPFPYPMMAMHFLREDMSKFYGPVDPAVQLQHYVDPASNDGSAYSYYMPGDVHQQSRRVPHSHTGISSMQQERYRTGQSDQGSASKVPVQVPVRRPSPNSSATGTGASQATRTEVTIHHSPGMTAQDYKESIEQEEEA